MKLSEMIATLPLELRKSITLARGNEMAQRAQFRSQTGIPICFCDPPIAVAARYQREHQRLAAPVLAQGADLRHLTDTDCDAVALQLITRPRRTLDWQTPGQARWTEEAGQQPVEFAEVLVL